MAMEEVDLGDKKELIAMVYGDKYTPITPPPSASPSTTATSSTPKKEKPAKKAPKKPSGILCSLSLCCALSILALLSIAAAAAITHLVTKRALKPFVPKPRGHALVAMKYNMSFANPDYDDTAEEVAQNEKAVEAEVAIADDERHLSHALEPVCYNLSAKIYLPGYGAVIPAEKEKTFDVVLFLTLRVKESTDRIELHSEKLRFDDKNLGSFELFKGIPTLRYRRSDNATNEHHGQHEEATTEAAHEEHEAADESDSAGANSTDSSTTNADGFLLNDTRDEEVSSDDHHTTPPPVALTPAGVRVIALSTDDARKKVVFQLDKKLTVGDEVVLRIPYSGPIRDSLNGLFLSKYKAADGQTKYIASTHMQPHYARRFVPCFDEPMYRATWKIEVIHPAGTTALSNGIEEHTSKQGKEWRVTSFKETPPMASYLLSICVFDFDFVEGTTQHGTRMRVYARPDAVNHTDIALETGIKALEFYEKHYDQQFPLKKQDMVALPTFEAGAMENWGLLMYREERLIYDPRNNDHYDKFVLLRTITHEISHQWFGDLVTMSWWNDLWLNEGLAMFAENEASDAIAGAAMRIKEYFIPFNLEPSFTLDAKVTSHPVSYKVEKPREIEALFDIITYRKSASVLRMLQAIVGPDAFLHGIQNHLNKFMYMSTTSADFFSSLDEVVPDEIRAWDGEKFSIARFAVNWIEQMGYPVVTVRRVGEGEVELSQNRFKHESLSEEKKQFRNAKFWYKWDVPVWYEVDGQSRQMEWLHQDLRLAVNASQLLLINPDSLGFYRVNYDREGWLRIAEQLKKDHSAIPPSARARLLSDAFQLAETGLLEYETAFTLTDYMEAEAELLPWLAAIEAYQRILDIYRDRPESKPAREFLQKRVAPLYAHLNWEDLDGSADADFFQSELNKKALDFFCRLHVNACTNRLHDIFQKQLLAVCPHDGHSKASECSRVPLVARSLSYCEGISRGGPSTLRRVQSLYERETHAGEKQRLLTALACSRDTADLKQLISSSLLTNASAASIPAQQLQFFVKSLERNPVSDYVLLDYVVDHWKQLSRNLADYQFSLAKVIGGLPVRSERALDKLNAFLAANKASTGRFGSFSAVIESAQSAASWLNKHAAEVDTVFLASKGNATDSSASAADSGNSTTSATDDKKDDAMHDMHFSPLFTV